MQRPRCPAGQAAGAATRPAAGCRSLGRQRLVQKATRTGRPVAGCRTQRQVVGVRRCYEGDRAPTGEGSLSGIYSLLAMVVKVLLRLVPTKVNAAIAATAINAAINAYSIAVTPDSSLIRFAKSVRNPDSPPLGGQWQQIAGQVLIKGY